MDLSICDIYEVASRVLHELNARGATLSVAESLTGGALAAAIVDVPGASATFRGGVVAYATDSKARILGVDAKHLSVTGPVDPLVAQHMARGVAQLFSSSYAVATTGVAGPGPADGRDAGTVYIALLTPSGCIANEYHFAGDRADVRTAAVREALNLLAQDLGVTNLCADSADTQ